MNSSIVIANHDDKNLLSNLLNIIEQTFDNKDSFYFDLPSEEYRRLMIEAQKNLNDHCAASLICKNILPELENYLETTKFLIQSNVYLRASRPSKDPKSESIGFHRETFYGENMEKAVNVWTPLKGVSKTNTLRYIPESHLVPDSDILTSKKEDSYTKRFSDGHKLGFQYAPKTIESGVNLNDDKPMIVKNHSSSIFSGNLIHGGAINNSDSIRFSIDFRIIRCGDYNMYQSKRSHFSSGKPYFIEMN